MLTARVKSWYEAFGERALLGLSFLLVAVLSFEAGWLQKSLRETGDPIVVNVAPQPAAPAPPTVASVSSESSPQAAESTQCVFVGSKKSNKYHHPASRCAKQIKLENKRCFESLESATRAGYLPGCLE